MTEKMAQNKGYSFTGFYSRDKEEMKVAALKLREQGNKAVVVDVPTSKYSRSGYSMGYSVYWIESEENKFDRETQRKENQKRSIISEIEKHKEAIAFLETELKNLN